MNAAFYSRVSTDHQDGSLETQDARSLAYAVSKGLVIPEELKFTDPDTSGSLPLLEREGGQLMMNTLKLSPDAKHLIITKLDRLGRNTIDVLQVLKRFEEMGVIVHIVDLAGDTITTQGAIGKFFLTILAGAAELERDFIRGRVQDRLDHKRSKGELCGTEPYGWRKVDTGQVNSKSKPIYRLEPSPEEQHWLRQMADWRAAGWSYKKIADELNRLQVATKTPKGTPICVRIIKATGERIMKPHSGLWQCGNVAGVLESRYTQDLLDQQDAAA